MQSRRIAALAAAGAFVLAGPVAARASTQATLLARDLAGSSGHAAARFDLVGLHWQGAGTVRFRTRSVAGRWSAWRAADLADAFHASGWRFGEPYWTGPSEEIEWRASGGVRHVRAFFVWSPVEAVPERTTAIAGSPPIILRPAWKADEKIRRAAPRYADAVHFAVVHHTAGTNDYTPAESAAIVRGIELYHVKGNGWNDIGYNFLVDRYGRVFEGRYGGITRNVVGAHAGGFNSGSTGVAVIGDYMTRQISPAARSALARLLAWRLDVAHADPLSTLVWPSSGNAEFPPGTLVTLRAVSGHRDTGYTDCPGDALYAQLPSIAASVARTGLPKLYDPVVRGSLGGPVRFSARLSSPQAWSVAVRDPAGVPVAAGSGTGATIRWTWDASLAQGPSYAWTMEAGPSVRAASGTIAPSTPTGPPKPLPPVLAQFGVSPAAISPDGDGYADAATVSYRLRRSALVTARVLDVDGIAVATLFQDQRQGARLQSWAWTADALPDGYYTLEVAARGGDGKVVRAGATVLVDRTLGHLSAQPALFSPNGDGKDDTIAFAFDLTAPANVTVQVEQGGREVAVVFQGGLESGPQQFVWNGQTPAGTVPDGQYDLVVSAVDAVGETSESAPFAVDSTVQ